MSLNCDERGEGGGDILRITHVGAEKQVWRDQTVVLFSAFGIFNDELPRSCERGAAGVRRWVC